MTMFCGVRGEDDGIDDGVADEGGEGQPHGERIDHVVQHEHASAAQQARQAQHLVGGDGAARGRSPCGAQHAGVDLLLDQTVDGEGGGGQQPDAQRAEQHALHVGNAGRGQEHADDGAEHRKLRDARLGEHEILAEQSGLGSGKTGHDGPYFKRARRIGAVAPRAPSGGGQTHHQYHRRQRQAGRPAIVQHRDQKRPLEEDGGQPGQQLRAQQRQHQRGRSAQPGLGAQAPGQHAQVGEHHEGEIAMDPVDRGERRLRDHFAGRQLAQPRITE